MKTNVEFDKLISTYLKLKITNWLHLIYKCCNVLKNFKLKTHRLTLPNVNYFKTLSILYIKQRTFLFFTYRVIYYFKSKLYPFTKLKRHKQKRRQNALFYYCLK